MMIDDDNKNIHNAKTSVDKLKPKNMPNTFAGFYIDFFQDMIVINK
jgi:hypothetical protein